jgi:ketosteroid isomerase-like protein
VPALLEVAHPEIEIHPVVGWLDMQPSFHGHAGVREYFAGLEQAFGHLRYELLSLEEHGDALVAEVRVHAHGRGSGAPLSLPIFQVLWIEDGLLRRVRTYDAREAALAAVAG